MSMQMQMQMLPQMDEQELQLIEQHHKEQEALQQRQQQQLRDLRGPGGKHGEGGLEKAAHPEGKGGEHFCCDLCELVYLFQGFVWRRSSQGRCSHGTNHKRPKVSGQ
jgi:hypothetical protein